MRVLFALLAVVAVVVLVRGLLAQRGIDRMPRSGAPAGDDDPLMREAVREAQASLDRLRALSGRASEAWVRLPVHDARGDAGHVWASLEAIEADCVVAAWRRPAGQGRDLPERGKRPLGDIEDWQVTMPDGAIHGGYTTRAQIAIARRAGDPIPDEVLDQERRFVDHRSDSKSSEQP